jgi:hypothetical protein
MNDNETRGVHPGFETIAKIREKIEDHDIDGISGLLNSEKVEEMCQALDAMTISRIPDPFDPFAGTINIIPEIGIHAHEIIAFFRAVDITTQGPTLGRYVGFSIWFPLQGMTDPVIWHNDHSESGKFEIGMPITPREILLHAVFQAKPGTTTKTVD